MKINKYFKQNIDLAVILGPLVKQKRAKQAGAELCQAKHSLS